VLFSRLETVGTEEKEKEKNVLTSSTSSRPASTASTDESKEKEDDNFLSSSSSSIASFPSRSSSTNPPATSDEALGNDLIDLFLSGSLEYEHRILPRYLWISATNFRPTKKASRTWLQLWRRLARESENKKASYFFHFVYINVINPIYNDYFFLYFALFFFCTITTLIYMYVCCKAL